MGLVKLPGTLGGAASIRVLCWVDQALTYPMASRAITRQVQAPSAMEAAGLKVVAPATHQL